MIDFNVTGRTAIVTRTSQGIGATEEMANAVVFLCSNAAAYINRQAISIDGGSSGHI